jgi:hypothetical protein
MRADICRKQTLDSQSDLRRKVRPSVAKNGVCIDLSAVFAIEIGE